MLTSTLLALNLFLPALAANWGYEEPKGPSTWPGVCLSGISQSPIDITKGIKTTMRKFVFNGYEEVVAKSFSMTNNGHTVKATLNLAPGQTMPQVTGGGLLDTHIFAQFHFHWGSKDTQGSEHTINGTSYPLELHLVHFNSKYGQDLGSSLAKSRGAVDGLAVLGIFFELQNEDNPDFTEITNALGLLGNKNDKTEVNPVPMGQFLPQNTDNFFRYQGSLTTPGCNEVVIWTVFKEPVGISHGQMALFRQLFEGEKGGSKQMVDNFRPTMPLMGRTVQDVDTGRHLSAASRTTSVTTMALISLTYLLFSIM